MPMRHRPWELFEKVFYGLFEHRGGESRAAKRKFRFKNKLVSLDSTVIDLCLSMFDWAKFRRTKGAVKLHLVLDHDGYLPCFAVITDGNVHDVKVAWQIALRAGHHRGRRPRLQRLPAVRRLDATRACTSSPA